MMPVPIPRILKITHGYSYNYGVTLPFRKKKILTYMQSFDIESYRLKTLWVIQQLHIQNLVLLLFSHHEANSSQQMKRIFQSPAID